MANNDPLKIWSMIVAGHVVATLDLHRENVAQNYGMFHAWVGVLHISGEVPIKSPQFQYIADLKAWAEQVIPIKFTEL